MRRRHWILLLVVPTVLVYLPVVRAYFLADDFSLFLRRIDWSDYRSVLLTHLGYIRPIPGALIWAEHALWGMNPLPAHLISLLLHVGCTLLLALLALRLSRDPNVALATGLLFGLHPINVQVVSWVSCTFDLCLGIFSLGCLVGYHAFRESGRRSALVLALVLFTCALLSKEAALCLLPVLIVYEAVVWRRFLGRALVPFALLLLAYLALRYHLLGGIGGRMDSEGSSVHLDIGIDTLWSIVVAPLRPLLLPFNTAWWQGRETPLVVLILASLVALVTALARARVAPFSKLTLFGLALAVLAMAPAASLIQGRFLGDLSQSRFLYLPAAGFCMVLGVALGRLAPARTGRLITGILACTYAVVTVGNVLPWRTAGRISKTVVSSVAALYPAPPRRSLLVIEDPPVAYRGAFVFLRSNALIKAVQLTHPAPPRVSLCFDQVQRYVDLRSFPDPDRAFVARWDPELERLLDLTQSFRASARRPLDRPSRRRITGADLEEWTLPGNDAVVRTDGTLGLEPGVVGRVGIESPPLPAGTGTLEIELCHAGLVASAARLRAHLSWKYEGEDWGLDEASFQLARAEGCHLHTLRLPLRRVSELDAGTLRVRLALPQGSDLRIRAIQVVPFASPTHPIVKPTFWTAFHRPID